MTAVTESFLSSTSPAELLDVLKGAQSEGMRVVVDRVDDQDRVFYSLIGRFEAPAADVTENLPPQCSF